MEMTETTTEGEDLEQLEGTGAEGEGEEAAGEQEAAADEPAGVQEDGAPPRASRRDRQEARKRNLVSERDEARAEAARLRAVMERLAVGQDRTSQAVGQMATAIARQAEKPAEDPVTGIKTKMRQALAAISRGDEGALERYEDLQVDLAETVAERRASAALAQAQKDAPQPDDEAVAAVKGRYTWLRTNGRAANAVRETALHLAEKGRRDMNDYDTRLAVLEEAAATVAAAWKLPTPGAARGASAARFAAGSGRGGAQGGDPMSSYQMTPGDWMMAKRAFPGVTDKGKLEAAYRKMAGEELAKMQRR